MSDERVKRLMRSYRLPVDVLDAFAEAAKGRGLQETTALIEAMELWIARQTVNSRKRPK